MKLNMHYSWNSMLVFLRIMCISNTISWGLQWCNGLPSSSKSERSCLGHKGRSPIRHTLRKLWWLTYCTSMSFVFMVIRKINLMQLTGLMYRSCQSYGFCLLPFIQPLWLHRVLLNILFTSSHIVVLGEAWIRLEISKNWNWFFVKNLKEK